MLTVEEQIRLIADAAVEALGRDTAAQRRATPSETVLDPMPVADTSSPVQFADEVVTMIDVETADPTEPRPKGPTRGLVAGILAAAAVVAVGFVVIRDADDVTPGDEPSTTVPLTRLPEAVPNGDAELLEPGTYFVDEVDGTRISFTLDTRWASIDQGIGWGTGRIMFSRADRVFSDACQWSDGYYPGPVANLDDFAVALSAQGGWIDVSGPSDISIDGYAGKAFQRTVPSELWDCTVMPFNWGTRIRPKTRALSDLPGLRSWGRYGTSFGDPEDYGGAGDVYEPGEVETVWVLDIDGTVVIINARMYPSAVQEHVALAGPTAEVRAQFAAVLDSIRIDRV